MSKEHEVPPNHAPRTGVRGDKRRLPIVPISVAIIAAAAGTAITLIGVSNIPKWALALLTAGVTLAGALASNGLTASTMSEKILSLWLTVGLLVAILVGQWIFQAAWIPTVPAFVNVVPTQDVTLSATPGAPPRSDYNAPVLIGGEEQSTYCYVKLGREIWLNFRSGWAPLSDFRNVEGFALQLPAVCTGASALAT